MGNRIEYYHDDNPCASTEKDIRPVDRAEEYYCSGTKVRETVPMQRYLLFAYKASDLDGGWCSFVGHFNNYKKAFEASRVMRQQGKAFQIVDGTRTTAEPNILHENGDSSNFLAHFFEPDATD